MKFSEKDLIERLDEWTYLKRKGVPGLPWWGYEGSKYAYEEIRRIIHKHFKEATHAKEED